jgi:hypothetical protein
MSIHSYDNPSDAILREHEAKVELDMMPCTGATNKDIPQRPAELIAPRYETPFKSGLLRPSIPFFSVLLAWGWNQLIQLPFLYRLGYSRKENVE